MLHTLKVKTADLAVGMYVSGLDRPWLETPFMIQGFCVEDAEQIEKVRRYCEHVFVDVTKSRDQTHPLLKQARMKNGAAIPIKDIFPGRPLRPYPNASSKWNEESAQAWVVLDTLVDDVNHVFEHVSDGGTLNVIRLKRSVEPVVESMSRNPDACIWLARLKQHDQYAYQHSLSASIWAVALGRQLGLPRHDLRSLAVGCMLMDVGKLRLDPKLLNATRTLSEDETNSVREHVSHGIEIVQDSGLMNQDILDIVAHHHERWDGSGYPEGMAGTEIPSFARIAAIVDTYDAVTSNRSHAPAISPSNAIKMLYRSRNIDFQAELVEVFIQAVGIYPAGTIVELTTGEVGVVVSEYRTRRLKPKVLMILDARKYRLDEPRLVDLSEGVGDPSTPQIGIARSLEPGAHSIDLSELDI